MSAEPLLKFGAAVIEPSGADANAVWLIPESGGGFRAQNVTVWQLIKVAYYIRDQQLTGGPAWIKADRYDITATPEETQPRASTETTIPPISELAKVWGASQFTSHLARNRQRLQALLRDRFDLVLQTETRLRPFYSLKLANTGKKLEVAGDYEGNPIARARTGSLTMTGDMKGLAAMLTDEMGQVVIDETGVTGNYQIKLEWTPGERGNASLLAAVHEQLGLQLEPTTGPLSVYVIEKVERPNQAR